MSRFVLPETERYDLAGGDYIVVKKRLTIGERKRLESVGITRTFGNGATVDWEQYQIGRAFIWLAEWGGPGFMVDGKSMPLSLEALRNVSEETFTEINAVLNAHQEKIEEAKKAQALATTV